MAITACYKSFLPFSEDRQTEKGKKVGTLSKGSIDCKFIPFNLKKVSSSNTN